jgi:large subunit ribosomal protein L10
MALRLEDKKTLVAEVNAVAGSSLSLVAAEYRGLTVDQMTALRKDAREAGVYMRVVKNTLARRAVEGTEFECVKEDLSGPLLLAFSKDEPGAAARVVKSFAKDHEHLIAKIVSVGGKAMPGSELERLASLPTREQALSMLVGVMQAPIAKFVRTLNEPLCKLARAVAAVRDAKPAD